MAFDVLEAISSNREVIKTKSHFFMGKARANIYGRQVYNNPHYLLFNNHVNAPKNEAIAMKPSICMSAAGDYKHIFPICCFQRLFVYLSFVFLSLFTHISNCVRFSFIFVYFSFLLGALKWIQLGSDANIYDDNQQMKLEG